jgi:hypothetical protein
MSARTHPAYECFLDLEQIEIHVSGWLKLTLFRAFGESLIHRGLDGVLDQPALTLINEAADASHSGITTASPIIV